MLTINKTFTDENDKLRFVSESEARFIAELDRVAQAVREEEGLKVVTLSGPSCSGKTTTAETLIYDWNKLGKRVLVISIDDFFRDRTDLLAEAKSSGHDEPDFETVRAIDFALLSDCVEKINRGEVVTLPRFDFTKGKRGGYEDVNSADYDVVIFEGIQAIYPEVTELFRHYRHKSIFVSVADDVLLNGVYFSRRKVRFLRRLVRDYNFRASSPEYTFRLWSNVARNEDKNILPFADSADITLNSFLPYELFVIKSYAIPLLRAVPAESEYAAEAEQIISRLEKLDDISSDYVPDESVFREFIGPRAGKN